MEWMHAGLLAVLQGVTEFLPISSSGHLVLLPMLFDWADQGLAFDVAVHVGTLIAVLLYFYTDIWLLVREGARSIITGRMTAYSRLAWAIVCATVLIGAAGLLLESYVETLLRNPLSIATATIFFGLLLGAADIWGRQQRRIEEITFRALLFIGCAQVLALIPGTSRSGITITAGMTMGLTRNAAARFSFLMAVPVLFLAGIWQGYKLTVQTEPVDWSVLGFAVFISALVAMACIHFFLGYLQKFSLLPFVWYRLILGVILLAIFM